MRRAQQAMGQEEEEGIGEEGEGGELTKMTNMSLAGSLRGGCGRLGG